MDFTWTPEQLELRRMLRDVTSDRCGPARLRQVIADAEWYDEALWRLLAGELGLLGVAAPTDVGGNGGSFLDAAVVIEESGSGLWPVPVLSALAAVSALAPLTEAAEVLATMCAGERRATLVPGGALTQHRHELTGTATHVVGAEGADLLVVATGEGLWVVDAAVADIATQSGLDPLRPLSTVRFDAAPGLPVGNGYAAGHAVDLLRVALAVEAVGVAQHCLELTVGYLKTREQFGRPIGSFQALAHRAADLAVEMSAATSTAYYAAWAVADAPDEVPVVAPLAKSVCGDAAYRITAETIQMHGGIGFTWEHDAHLYFKRATSTRLLLGDSHEQRRLVAARAQLL
jgi:alkylation response protein AidB-like acyl-CoA dehydrogenase